MELSEDEFSDDLRKRQLSRAPRSIRSSMHSCYICGHNKTDILPHFRFPTDPNSRRRWCIALNIDSNANVQNLRLCGKHFKHGEMMEKHNRTFLHKNAVPTLHLNVPFQENGESNSYFCVLCGLDKTRKSSYFKFPQDADLRYLWERTSGIDTTSYDFEPRLCDRHFTESDFSTDPKYSKRRRLLKTAVPSRHLIDALTDKKKEIDVENLVDVRIEKNVDCDDASFQVLSFKPKPEDDLYSQSDSDSDTSSMQNDYSHNGINAEAYDSPSPDRNFEPNGDDYEAFASSSHYDGYLQNGLHSDSIGNKSHENVEFSDQSSGDDSNVVDESIVCAFNSSNSRFKMAAYEKSQRKARQCIRLQRDKISRQKKNIKLLQQQVRKAHTKIENLEELIRKMTEVTADGCVLKSVRFVNLPTPSIMIQLKNFKK